jgi:hypothetical protein
MSVMRRAGQEDGQGLVAALLLLAGVLLPLLFVVPLFARIEQGRLATAQVARDAVRAAVESPSPEQAQEAAMQAIERGRSQTRVPLQVELDGEFERGGALRAKATAEVALASIPFFGDIGTVTVQSEAAAPIDRYRSLIEGEQ